MANLGAEWVCAWCKAAFVTSANYPAAAAKGGLQEQARLQGGVWPALEVTSEEVEVAAAAAAAAAKLQTRGWPLNRSPRQNLNASL